MGIIRGLISSMPTDLDQASGAGRTNPVGVEVHSVNFRWLNSCPGKKSAADGYSSL